MKGLRPFRQASAIYVFRNYGYEKINSLSRTRFGKLRLDFQALTTKLATKLKTASINRNLNLIIAIDYNEFRYSFFAFSVNLLR